MNPHHNPGGLVPLLPHHTQQGSREKHLAPDLPATLWWQPMFVLSHGPFSLCRCDMYVCVHCVWQGEREREVLLRALIQKVLKVHLLEISYLSQSTFDFLGQRTSHCQVLLKTQRRGTMKRRSWRTTEDALIFQKKSYLGSSFLALGPFCVTVKNHLCQLSVFFSGVSLPVTSLAALHPMSWVRSPVVLIGSCKGHCWTLPLWFLSSSCFCTPSLNTDAGGSEQLERTLGYGKIHQQPLQGRTSRSQKHPKPGSLCTGKESRWWWWGGGAAERSPSSQSRKYPLRILIQSALGISPYSSGW